MHGRLDLSKIAEARSCFLNSCAPPAETELDTTNHTQQQEDTEEATTFNEKNTSIRKESHAHLTLFLKAMSVAKQDPVPHYVQASVATTTSLLPPTLSIDGDSLDTFIVSIAARPTADQQVWQELHQVGHAKTEKDRLFIAHALQKIAAQRLIPELKAQSFAVVHTRESGRETDDKARDMLLLYRLTESMLNRKGKQMVRIAAAVDVER